MATSAAASPIGPDQTCSPVAGSFEVSSVAIFAGFITSASWSTLRCIGPHCLAHPADGCNLVVERLPVVACRDRRPDRLDLVNGHRARRHVGPIWVRLRALATVEHFCERPEGFGRVSLGPGIAPAAPVEEDT